LTTPDSLGILGAARMLERRVLSGFDVDAPRWRSVYRPAFSDAIVGAESVGAHS
jgi:hypothetical protein